LHRYYEETMTLAERNNKERKKVQDRLYGKTPNKHRHVCSTIHRCQSAEPKKTVRMELREVQDGVSMHDESNSAHQFSMENKSVGDSGFMKDMNVQTSDIVYKSNNE